MNINMNGKKISYPKSTIDIKSAIYNQRNNGLGSGFKKFIIECLGAIYARKFAINTYSFSFGKINGKAPNHRINLQNFSIFNQVGVQEHIITEFAAICANLAIIPLVCPYYKITVTKRTDGADYFLREKKDNFVLESKGDTTKYSYKSRIKEGKKEIFVSFKKLKKRKIHYGIIGLSRFIIEHHYFIKIENSKVDLQKGSEMQKSKVEKARLNEKNVNLDKLIEKSSQLITDAMAKEAKREYIFARQLYNEAFNISIQIASILEENGSLEAQDYWFSAANCALASEDLVIAMLIVNDLEEYTGLTDESIEELKELKLRIDSAIRIKETTKISPSFVRKILKWILFKVEEIHEKVRGKGVVMKLGLDFRQRLISYGYYLPISFNVNRNPIYSKKINQILEEYLESGLLLRNEDQSLNLTPKARKMLMNEKNNIEQVIRSKFTEKFLEEFIEQIKFLGNKTSKELMEIEKKQGITAHQYGRPIIHEVIKK